MLWWDNVTFAGLEEMGMCFMEGLTEVLYSCSEGSPAAMLIR